MLYGKVIEIVLSSLLDTVSGHATGLYNHEGNNMLSLLLPLEIH